MTNDNSPDKLIECQRPNTHASIRLFCFPYAGGSSLIYRNWAERLPASVEVCAIQLPGRGNRIKEPPLRRVTAIVEVVTQSILRYLDKPFVFFGHSMGALLSFEAARLLRRAYGLQPAHLFASARSAPKLTCLDPPLHAMPETALIAELRRLNGTPQLVLDSPELMSLLIPTLRADFEVCETYEYAYEPPLGCPLSVFGGLHDNISRERLEAWSEETRANSTLQMFPGDHFFLHSAEWLLLRALSRHLDQLAKASTQQ